MQNVRGQTWKSFSKQALGVNAVGQYQVHRNDRYEAIQPLDTIAYSMSIPPGGSAVCQGGQPTQDMGSSLVAEDQVNISILDKPTEAADRSSCTAQLAYVGDLQHCHRSRQRLKLPGQFTGAQENEMGLKLSSVQVGQ